MKNNPKALIALFIFSLAIVIGVFWAGSSDSTKTHAKSHETTSAFDVAAGDTNNEVLQSIIAKQKDLEAKNKHLMQVNKELNQKSNEGVESELESLAASLRDEINKQKNSISELRTELKDKRPLNTKQSLKARGANSNIEYAVSGASDQHNSIHMIKLVNDLSPYISRKSLGDDNTSKNSDVAPSLPSDLYGNNKQKNSKPIYTIPNGATVANVALLSPLIGEIPVNKQLMEPAYPFKAIISYHDTKDMFAANGISLPPGISGTVLQGYSVGNMSLGCSRAYVMRILFVFDNGHFVVFPKKSSDDATSIYPKNAIGYLSDAYNNPCINGQYITDAPKVIGSLSTLGGISGAGQAVAQAQTQTLSNITQGTTGTIVNGNLGKYALGLSVNNGAKEALDWYKARVNDVFDAVYVSPLINNQPRKLIFNITQTIPIDLDKAGRTLSNEANKNFTSIDHSFD